MTQTPIDTLTVLIGALFGFASCRLLMPHWIRLCQNNDALWEDMNKWGTPRNVAMSGGCVVITTFLLSSLLLLSCSPSFAIPQKETLAILLCVCLASLTGLADDLIGWKKGGIPWQTRLPLALTLCLPLLPLLPLDPIREPLTIFGLGPIPIETTYSLLVITLLVAGTTTTFNLLAGFNGLEAGQGLLILSTLSILLLKQGTPWLAALAMTLSGGLAAFLVFNWSPARVFPGDSLTWGVGCLIGCLAIIGQLALPTAGLLSLYALEAALKAGRGHLKKPSFGIPNPNGTLEIPYPKAYGTTHLAMMVLKKALRRPCTETSVTILILSTQTLICLATLLLWK
jgi:UDP-N-acetylglucosamine--dolichyl-phosphate N-acetylglucosaminephosphotransferase